MATSGFASTSHARNETSSRSAHRSSGRSRRETTRDCRVQGDPAYEDRHHLMTRHDTGAAGPGETPRLVHPAVWMVLFFPFGATSGFVSVTIGYLAKQQGIGDAAIAGLVAMSVLPHTFKFFWAPLPDTTFTRRRWYFGSNILSSLTLIGLALVPIRSDTLQLLRVLIFVNSLAVTFLGMAVEGLLAHTVSDTQRGTASGWLQAGNLGGAGLGGGLALF